jgi:hypothetical protein
MKRTMIVKRKRRIVMKNMKMIKGMKKHPLYNLVLKKRIRAS